MVVRFLVKHENFQAFAMSLQETTNHLLALVIEALFMAALCSPFSERCFGWLVSPQWLLDAAAAFLYDRSLLHSRAQEAQGGHAEAQTKQYSTCEALGASQLIDEGGNCVIGADTETMDNR